MKSHLVSLFQQNLVRPSLVPFYTHLYKLSLRGMGVLNSEGSEITGEAWLMQHVKQRVPIRVICDVGGNDGGYARELAAAFPEAVVHSFEPNPETFALLTNNLVAGRIKPYNLAMGDVQKKIKLYDFADSAPLKSSQPTATLASVYKQVIEQLHRQPTKAYLVSMTTLDRWTAKSKVTQIDWLKIDTEGHELAVLKGAKVLLKKKQIGLIQLEFNEMNVYSRTFLRDIMLAMPDYHVYRLLPKGLWPLENYRPLTHEVFGFQNIVAIKPEWNAVIRTS